MLVFAIAFSILGALASASLAARKYRNVLAWGALGGILPLPAVIAIVMVRPLDPSVEQLRARVGGGS
jgi:hypothetical protein